MAVVARSLREAILRGDYGPHQRLIEGDICAELSASRFTVRAALQELANEGLVVVQRNKGARVRAISIEEAVEITEVRMAVEGLTASLAAKNVTAYQASELEEIGLLMRRAVEVGELMRYSELNVRLHALVREIARHATATRILEQLRGQMTRHQFVLSLQPGRSSVSLPQHARIISAIVRRDPVEAEQAMRDHIGSVIAALRVLPPLAVR
jgi:DNA-binding GntR family transcriptional regulator